MVDRDCLRIKQLGQCRFFVLLKISTWTSLAGGVGAHSLNQDLADAHTPAYLPESRFHGLVDAFKLAAYERLT